MYYSHTIRDSYVDGPGGPRTVLFMQGCDRHCPGCQNKHLWPFNVGKRKRVHQLAHSLLVTGQPITISGGEPFAQPGELSLLLQTIRILADRHIIVYSGHTWEELMASRNNATRAVVANCDILVDGPYICGQDHDYLQWRGSSNQRPICVPETLASGRLVVADWDTPTLAITNDGCLIGAAGLIDELGDGGRETRRCGQTMS